MSLCGDSRKIVFDNSQLVQWMYGDQLFPAKCICYWILALARQEHLAFPCADQGWHARQQYLHSYDPGLSYALHLVHLCVRSYLPNGESCIMTRNPHTRSRGLLSNGNLPWLSWWFQLDVEYQQMPVILPCHSGLLECLYLVNYYNMALLPQHWNSHVLNYSFGIYLKCRFTTYMCKIVKV